jgi:IS1 family transposase/transposase-like protein
MTCHNCRTQCKRFGHDRNGYQRHRCRQCGKVYCDRPERLEGTYLSGERVIQIVRLFVEGCSVRSIERITGTHRDTILNILVLAGERCERLLENSIHEIPARDVQCDEIWGFVGCKEKRNITGDPQRGDAFCFVAIERNTKLVLAWHLGRRTRRDALAFTERINEATAGHFQVTTDGFPPYFDAVHTSLGTRVDYSQLVKLYGTADEGERWYSPPKVIDAIPKPMWGNPDPGRICTSHVERQNLTLRMHMRRLTRLTNGFSKSWYNLKCAFALQFAYYNFCRIHQSLRVTPAMEAGLTDHLWQISEMLR